MPPFRRIRKAILIVGALSAAAPVTIERSGRLSIAEACAEEGKCCYEVKSMCIQGERFYLDRYNRSSGRCESPAY